MILDSGICTVFRKTDTSDPGDMPTVDHFPIWASWYAELSYETTPTWQTEGRKEQRADGRIRVLQCRSIRQDDVVVLEHLASFNERSEGAVVYRITRAFHGVDDEGPTMIYDLTLEVIDP